LRDSVKPGTLVGEQLGSYHLLALLALGGTAEIYLARIGGEAGFEKHVVVKCLLDHLADDSEFVRMFLDEARLGAQLDHSNIVHTLGLGEQRGRYYMVMEYLAGMSLAQLARKVQDRVHGGLLPPDLSLLLTVQACSGLDYAHKRVSEDGRALRLVHRDISPQNLVVSFEGVLKIVDFGIAKAEVRETHTKNGTIKGKFAYMSPEQCLGKAIDHRTDIFALGTTLHELLTGRRLFKRQSTYETYQAIVSGKVPLPSSINSALDPELDRVVMEALAYEPGQRYPNAGTFGEAILAYLHRRGKTVSSGDLSEYIELYFGPELEEHAQRMRELVSGRTTSARGLVWDPEDVAEARSLASTPVRATAEERLREPNVSEPTEVEGPPAVEADTGSELVETGKLDIAARRRNQMAAGGPPEAPTPPDSPGTEGESRRIGGQGEVATPDAQTLMQPEAHHFKASSTGGAIATHDESQGTPPRAGLRRTMIGHTPTPSQQILLPAAGDGFPGKEALLSPPALGAAKALPSGPTTVKASPLTPSPLTPTSPPEASALRSAPGTPAYPLHSFAPTPGYPPPQFLPSPAPGRAPNVGPNVGAPSTPDANMIRTMPGEQSISGDPAAAGRPRLHANASWPQATDRPVMSRLAPIWLLALVFAIAVGLGLGATVLLVRLLA
jgi:serine/threonine-protein kinase